MTTVVVNSGLSNVRAIPNMLARLGVNTVVSGDPREIEKAGRIIMPGVGSFDAAVGRLRNMKLWEVLQKKVVDDGTPVLGICLGMHLFADSSEEGALRGFGWIPGTVRRFSFEKEADRTHLKVPHMGWNLVKDRTDEPLLHGMGQEARFYFGHSFYYDCIDASHWVGETTYGFPFASMVRRGHIFGVQFHPEKSHRFGLTLLENFIACSSRV
jgi:glutamine amidotransferase